MKDKNKFGQYMTPEIISDFMVGLIEHKADAKCLEPSSGNGIFMKKLKDCNYNNITAYEIDKNIIDKSFEVINKSFISTNIKEKFDVIIGNPPYIRWKNLETVLKDELDSSTLWNTYCNSLCDYSSIFILKSVDLLKDNGELIFITSDYWFTTTHAKKIRNYLLKNGYFSNIIHFNETPLFPDVNASFVIFKYIKNNKCKKDINITKFFSKKKINSETLTSLKTKTNKQASYFTIPQFKINEKWILTEPDKLKEINMFEECCNKATFGDICNIGNGMVSGLDKAFQLPANILLNINENKNTIQVLKAKSLKAITYGSDSKYIFLPQNLNEKTLKQKYPNFLFHLNKYKNTLKNRYNYGKNLNYWEWAFLRNYNLFSKNEEKIFCPCKERITNKSRFRFSIVPAKFYPTQDVTALFLNSEVKENIKYVAGLLNSKYVFNWLSNKGTRKGDIVEFSEKPIKSIPYRKIDFSNTSEKAIHDKIVQLVTNYEKNENPKLLIQIDKYIENLLKLRSTDVC